MFEFQSLTFGPGHGQLARRPSPRDQEFLVLKELRLDAIAAVVVQLAQGAVVTAGGNSNSSSPGCGWRKDGVGAFQSIAFGSIVAILAGRQFLWMAV